MPRDGSNIYSQPFPPVEEDTTIESAVYNGFTADVSLDLNNARPILSGGTGATNARDALINLNAEAAKQVVTNYDSYPWVAGSFYSAATASLPGAPVDGHAFVGVAYLVDNNNIVLEARDQNDTVVPGRVYVREKKAGVWSAWTLANDDKLDLAGGVMTGPLTIDADNPFLLLDKKLSGQSAYVAGALAHKSRWTMTFGDNAAETATDGVGSDFHLFRHNNAGAVLDVPISISRQTGTVQLNGQEKVSRAGDTMLGPLVLPAAFPTLATHAANKDYVDKAPRNINFQAVDYRLVLADAGKLVLMSKNGGFGLFVPTQAAVPFPVGTQIDVCQWASNGPLYINPDAGVSLYSEDNRRRLRGSSATATLVYIGGDNWLLTGSLIP